MTTITIDRATVEQALEAMRCAVPTGKITLADWHKSIAELEAALAQQVKHVAWMRPWPPVRAQIEMDAGADFEIGPDFAQQAEPVPGKVVAWGVFAKIDGEWQLQHPVFVGDECGKENAEFERASYSGPQPLEVRPLGVVTATAQQAEPVPVAWMDPASGDVISDARHEAWERDFGLAGKGKAALFTVPLYTAPPQRKPLTVEEIDALPWNGSPRQFARAVERALEEQNRGR